MLGMKRRHTTQKFRDSVEIPDLGRLDIDHHPGLPPLKEVEAPSEQKLKRLLKVLDLKMPPVEDSRPKILYNEHYGIPLDRKPEGDLTFSHPSNLCEHIRNRDSLTVFDRVLQKQRVESAKMLNKHGLQQP